MTPKQKRAAVFIPGGVGVYLLYVWGVSVFIPDSTFLQSLAINSVLFAGVAVLIVLTIGSIKLWEWLGK